VAQRKMANPRKKGVMLWKNREPLTGAGRQEPAQSSYDKKNQRLWGGRVKVPLKNPGQRGLRKADPPVLILMEGRGRNLGEGGVEKRQKHRTT